MYKFSYRIAICAVLVLISSIFTFSQKHRDESTQIIQGCAVSPYQYPPQTFIYNPYPNLVDVDKIETGSNKFIFTFSPDKGRYYPRPYDKPDDDEIKFSVFNYGMQPNSFHNVAMDGPRPNLVTPLEALDLNRRSTLREENYELLNWDETYLKSMASSGSWHVIYKYAGPLDAPRPDNGTYLSPIDEKLLASGKEELPVWPNPENHYSFKKSPSTPERGSGTLMTVKKLSDLKLKVSGWKEGYYWFTLQNDANFGGKTCQKTTPPVLIEISTPPPPPPTVRDLSISVKASSIECKSVTAIATVSLKNILENEVSISWEITDQNGNMVTPDYTSADKRTVTLNTNLKTGRYTFKATASADKWNLTRSASYSTTYICAGGGAGLVYFQFEVPDEKKRHLMIDHRDPEGWAGGDPKGDSDEKRDPYPTRQFPLFYGTTKAMDPVGGRMEKNNTRRLDEIVEMLRTYPDFHLKIFGYADFQATGTYSNQRLSERRIKAVKDYLVFKYQEKYGEDITGRISGRTVTEARSDRFAQSCDGYKWTDPRRWDRRAELIYTRDPNQPNPVYPPAPGCPQPAVTRKPAPRKKPVRPGRRR